MPHYEICGLKITPVVKTLGPYQEVEINIEYHSFMKKLGPNTLRDLNKANQPPEPEKPKEEEPAKDKKDDKKAAKKLSKAEQEAL